MNKKVRNTLIIWGGAIVVIIIISIIFLLNRSTEPPAHIEDDDMTINVHLLSDQEQASITTITKDFLVAFLTQSTGEPDSDRASRLAPYLTTNNRISNISLETLNSYSSNYLLIEKVSPTPPTNIIWSKVTSTEVSVYTTIDLSLTDSSGHSDLVSQNWFVVFHKQANKWLVYNLERGPDPPR